MHRKNIGRPRHRLGGSSQALPIKMAELVQGQLREVGIFLEIKQTDTAALFAIMNEGSQQMIFGRRAVFCTG